MRIALLDPFGGLAGDMLLGATLDLGVSPQALREALETLGVPAWTMRVEPTERRHIAATKVHFDIEDQKDHRHLPEILGYIEASGLTPRAKQMATRSFMVLAEAEAKAHRIPIEKVHFHEVGALDAILDVCGVCYALDALGVDALRCGSLPAGSGTVQCAHGEMPVPVPAVVNLLGDFTLRVGEGQGEMITPTGAALLVAWGEPLRGGEALRLSAAGYGAGTRCASILRLSLAELEAPAHEGGHDEVFVLETQVDDMSGEALAYLVEILMEGGALDVFVAPITMKKGRPGHALTVLAGDAPARERALATLFAESSTLGVRSSTRTRVVAARRIETVSTPYGEVRVKIAVGRARPEYEDCAARARAAEVPLERVFAAARRAASALEGVDDGRD